MNIQIYTSPLCGYCHAAKRLLQSKSVEFVEIDLANEPDRREEMVQRANGGRTVPQIFIDEIMSVDVMICTPWNARESLICCYRHLDESCSTAIMRIRRSNCKS